MYLSADNGNVSNLLGHITNTEKQYGVFADTTKKDSPLKESGAQFQNLTDGSGVNVKAEVLNKWIQSTGIERVLSKINQTGEKGFAFVNKAQKLSLIHI